MRNRMSEIASMFGLKLCERFSIIYDNGQTYDGCQFTSDGLHADGDVNKLLCDILTGKAVIMHKRYHPDEGGWYWYVRYDGSVNRSRWFNMTVDKLLYKMGNCYETEFEANGHRAEWIEYYKVPY